MWCSRPVVMNTGMRECKNVSTKCESLRSHHRLLRLDLNKRAPDMKHVSIAEFLYYLYSYIVVTISAISNARILLLILSFDMLGLCFYFLLSEVSRESESSRANLTESIAI